MCNLKPMKFQVNMASLEAEQILEGQACFGYMLYLPIWKTDRSLQNSSLRQHTTIGKIFREFSVRKISKNFTKILPKPTLYTITRAVSRETNFQKKCNMF